MGLKERSSDNIIRKETALCKSVKRNITYSFECASEDKIFGVSACKDITKYKAFIKKLKILSSYTWDKLMALPREKGAELMELSCFKEKARNALMNSTALDAGDKIYVSRAGESRIFFRRAKQCNREAEILAVEWTLGDAYNHS